ncbi:MAG: nucleotidyltransferase family protein [Oscillospiraceae bacterium]|nr:nucleotidyltransferase family protein [Oscillospiraceae bacterium]
MTYEFEYLMHLLGAASLGTHAQAPRQSVNWRKIFQMADDQMLTPLICDVLVADTALGYPVKGVLVKAEEATVKAMKECAKRLMIIDLLADMEKAGIGCIMVKGSVAAMNYAKPEKRFSTDTDIVVDPADEERACAFLRQRGFHVTDRWQNGHHASTQHDAMGVLEVHVRLYDEIVEDVWFGQIDPASFIQEPYQQIRTAEGLCNTLGDTDHLIFIILHMIKHFITAGMCLRMMMDTALFFKKRREKLDIDRIWSVVRQLNYDKLLSAILWTTVRYCGMNPEDLPGIGPEEPELVGMIVSDLENGGFMGNQDYDVRAESSYEYNRQLLMKDKSKWQYRLYMLRWKHGFKLATIFPGKRRLAPRYPYVVKHPWLIPFAWVHRWVTRGWAMIFKKELSSKIVMDEKKVAQEAKERVEMFRCLGMME